MWMHRVELPHFPFGSPTQVAVAGIAQVELSELVEPARPVEGGSALIGERLVVYEAICAGRVDCLFEEAHRINIASLDASNLRSHQRRAVLEILWAIRGPDLQSLIMRSDSVYMLLLLVGRCEAAIGGSRQRGIKVMLGFLQERR